MTVGPSFRVEAHIEIKVINWWWNDLLGPHGIPIHHLNYFNFLYHAKDLETSFSNCQLNSKLRTCGCVNCFKFEKGKKSLKLSELVIDLELLLSRMQNYPCVLSPYKLYDIQLYLDAYVVQFLDFWIMALCKYLLAWRAQESIKIPKGLSSRRMIFSAKFNIGCLTRDRKKICCTK